MDMFLWDVKEKENEEGEVVEAGDKYMETAKKDR